MALNSGSAPAAISSLVVGTGPAVGQALAADAGVPLDLGHRLGARWAGRWLRPSPRRLGRSLLELGGNNAMSSPRRPTWNWPTRAIVFAAAGTCGQRCTTAAATDRARRRLPTNCLARLLKAVYDRLPIGDPLDAGVLVGPLIDRNGRRIHAAGSLQAAPSKAAVFTAASA